MKILKVLAIGVTVGGIALAMNSEKANAADWTPRSAEQIKAEINGNEYTIVWGDTLSAISQATNITVQKLADMNKIANVDLIYAGNKLVFDGNVATVQNSNGETVAQSVIQPQDKVDSTKPVGQPVQDTTNSATPVTDNPVAGNTQTGGQTTENTETTPSTPENNGDVTQTPTQPDNNQTGSTGGNTGGGQTTPSAPGNSGSTTTPSQPSNKPSGGNTGSSGSTGGNGVTTIPSQPQAPTIVAGKVGNSGMIFNTVEEATDWGNAQLDDPNSEWVSKGYTGFVGGPIIYSDGTTKYTVDFY
ncbi:LysM peptidoglycan-binding domain-containing protein [Enterococcus faecalis]|uniref:LysM peptidoglycan-binding domain-containing protein n=1 Tax=Enterococcus faecalis TaxID=1351 RepID=UPI001883BC0B|nr:LysM domain-containing protein [Enterococcus faecalis]MBE9855091.1 LysM peptidoglycan-binding domain-containing protein [Enterococcus faecalis]